ncbi:hypothetical protein D3C81_1872700 [compost metagenome]
MPADCSRLRIGLLGDLLILAAFQQAGELFGLNLDNLEIRIYSRRRIAHIIKELPGLISDRPQHPALVQQPLCIFHEQPILQLISGLFLPHIHNSLFTQILVKHMYASYCSNKQ